jgi:hypothetical protein
MIADESEAFFKTRPPAEGYELHSMLAKLLKDCVQNFGQSLD